MTKYGICEGALGSIFEILAFVEREGQLSFTIITEDAQGDLANLHNRMPVILDLGQASTWLEEQQAGSILVSTVYQPVEYYPVSTRVNSPRNQETDLIDTLFAGVLYRAI